MDGLALLAEAEAVGLVVTAEDGRLVVEGPRSAGAVAERLIAHKPVVLAALSANPPAVVDPAGVWWNDAMPKGSAPILHLPPRGCPVPRICARVGRCDRAEAGGSCGVAS